MTRHQYVILTLLVLAMAAIALSTGRWAESSYPDGLQVTQPVSGSDTTTAESANTQAAHSTRNAFTFGASMGLLACGLLYCLITFGLLIHAKSTSKTVGLFIYSVAGLAAAAFALSYVVDDYFY